MKKRHLNPLIINWVNLFMFGVGCGAGFMAVFMILFLFVTTVLN